MPAGEAERRVREVLHVVTGPGDVPVGVSSAYLQHNEQLRLQLWYYRLFVAQAHRTSNVAAALALTGRDHLENLFVTGQDARGAGILYVMENEGLKHRFRDVHMLPANVTFIGQNARGDHVRVRYFRGARAAEPPGGR